MVCSASSLLANVSTLVEIIQEHSISNPAELGRIKEMLDEKEVALVEKVKVAKWLMAREAELQTQLKVANKLLMQRDWELEVKWWRVDMVVTEKAKMEKKLQEEIVGLKDMSYVCYE